MQCDSILSESEAQDDSVLSYGCIYYNTSCLMISCFVARSYVFARMCAGANSAFVWQFVFVCECVCGKSGMSYFTQCDSNYRNRRHRMIGTIIWMRQTAVVGLWFAIAFSAPSRLETCSGQVAVV